MSDDDEFEWTARKIREAKDRTEATFLCVGCGAETPSSVTHPFACAKCHADAVWKQTEHDSRAQLIRDAEAAVVEAAERVEASWETPDGLLHHLEAIQALVAAVRVLHGARKP